MRCLDAAQILRIFHYSGGEYLHELKCGGDRAHEIDASNRRISLTGRTTISTAPMATSAAPASESLFAKASVMPSCGNT
jgi:hypothetical protein